MCTYPQSHLLWVCHSSVYELLGPSRGLNLQSNVSSSRNLSFTLFPQVSNLSSQKPLAFSGRLYMDCILHAQCGGADTSVDIMVWITRTALHSYQITTQQNIGDFSSRPSCHQQCRKHFTIPIKGLYLNVASVFVKMSAGEDCIWK